MTGAIAGLPSATVTGRWTFTDSLSGEHDEGSIILPLEPLIDARPDLRYDQQYNAIPKDSGIILDHTYRDLEGDHRVIVRYDALSTSQRSPWVYDYCDANQDTIGLSSVEFLFDYDLLFVDPDHQRRDYCLQTYFPEIGPGDANGDRRFNASDLVQVFKRGEYEDGLLRNSTWYSGDWNGDREFDTADLILAFQAGTYESGLAAAVPEPSTLDFLFCAACQCVLMMRHRWVVTS